MQNTIVEICAGSVDDVLVAESAGADRVELNSALPLGGLTPSIATLKIVKSKSRLPVIAMARPRPGNFCYNQNEFESLQREIDLLMEHGADGIAIGITDSTGEVDQQRLEKIVTQTQKHASFELVYHRAIDIAPNWRMALRQLIDLGFHRVLTSGQQRTAITGADCIAEMVSEFGNHIEILPGSGITPDNVAALVEKTTCRQIHGSFSAIDHTYETEVGHFGSVAKTDPDILRRVIEALR